MSSIQECPELQNAVYPIIRETLTYDKMLEIWSKNWVLGTKITSLPQNSSAQKVEKIADWILGLWEDGRKHYQEIYKEREEPIGDVGYKKRFEVPLNGPFLHQVMVAAERRADLDLEGLWMGTPFFVLSPDDFFYHRLQSNLENYPHRYSGIQLPSPSEWKEQRSNWLANPSNRPLLKDSRNFASDSFIQGRFPLYLQLQIELESNPNAYEEIQIPHFSAPAAELRDWLTDPSNSPLLECVEHLSYIHPSVAFLIPRRNVLAILPKEISLLPNLKSLTIVDSGLSICPASIGSLKHLERLMLIGGKLTELPDSICNIQSLKYLNLRFNQISTVSERLGDLTNLRFLHLWNNQISELPNSVGNLTKLEEIDMAKNKLAELPRSFSRITGNLKSVNFTCNNLCFKLPADLRDKQVDVLERTLSFCTIQ